MFKKAFKSQFTQNLIVGELPVKGCLCSKYRKNVYSENANMALCTPFCPTLSFLPASPVRSFQLSPSSNSLTPGLILMWLLSLSSPCVHFFLFFLFFHPPPFLLFSFFFLKNLPLMKLNSLVGSFFGLCVCACLGVCGYVSLLNWLELRSKAVSKLCVCVR